MRSLLDSSSPDSCNEKLLNAVRAKHIDEVQRQLKNPNINVNYDIGNGETVLFESLKADNIAIFECLVNFGFDIHCRNIWKKTPLHIATTDSDSSFVHALIKWGADVNAKDEDGFTPLSLAAQHGFLDKVCTLLYYDADVNAVCNDNMNPFMLALRKENEEVASILFDFYDDFSCRSNYGNTALQLAVMFKNRLCREIFKKTPNVNDCLDSVLRHSCDYENAEFFKLIWHKHKEQICLGEGLDVHGHNLLYSLFHCGFSNSDWFDCLYLLFTSQSTFENLLGFDWWLTEKGLTQESFLAKLIRFFYDRKIDLHHRMVLINLCLSFGTHIFAHDINVAYLLYGFNEEVETFIHAFNYQQTIIPKDFLPLPRFIFVLEDDYKISPIFEFWGNEYRLRYVVANQDIVNSLGYTTLSSLQKQTIKTVCMDYFEDHERIIQKLDAIPDMPSLLELSRNRIRQQYSGAKSYQLHIALNELNLPPYIKDVIRFKAPIY